MSDPKIVEAVGNGRVNVANLLKPNVMRPEITQVRVQKVRDGKVYEDVILKAPDGIHG